MVGGYEKSGAVACALPRYPLYPPILLVGMGGVN